MLVDVVSDHAIEGVDVGVAIRGLRRLDGRGYAGFFHHGLQKSNVETLPVAEQDAPHRVVSKQQLFKMGHVRQDNRDHDGGCWNQNADHPADAIDFMVNFAV
ncbi:hypothetical protein [Pandoraea sp.]|uniref:hypothetical protein n=1 Tax=Pandoraea sp. TaxID=1883445 RepID=UPI001229D194|nr:hypothetical protein [Pandoraea sp.]TAL52744.1 MAG: hypothetical protein EPN80_17955 [Pandoraea sp.]TAM17734.1 MAG: hypothetical protein EPN65_09960 [Pandoraea sp.]